MTPQDGPVETVDLTTAFSKTVLIGTDPRYREVIENRENLNRGLRPLLIGYRPEIRLIFEITDTTNDHPILGKIHRRLMDAYWMVELDLVNNGMFREIMIRRAASPKPLGKKTVVGARHELRVQCKDPIDRYPDIGPGTSW